MLSRRSEEDQWRLAELTWQQVKPQGEKLRSEWARDIGVHPSYVSRLYAIWRDLGDLGHQDRPRFADAYVKTIPNRAEEAEEHGSSYAANARRAIRNLPPEKKAEVIEELLRSEPAARAAAGRVLDEHFDAARMRDRGRDEPYKTPQSAPDFAVEVAVKLRAISAAIRDASDLVLSGPSLADAGGAGGLLPVIDWQTNALGIIRGRLAGQPDMDAELEKILREA